MANTLSKNEDTSASWFIVVPLAGIKPFPKGGIDEIKLLRVTLIEREKLLRCRSRFPIQQHRDFLKRNRAEDHFTSAEMYAVLRHTGTMKEIRRACLKIVEEELALFSTCRIGMKRGSFGQIGVLGQHSDNFIAHAFLDASSGRASMRHERLKCGMPLLLADYWKNYQKHSFFPKLLKILRGQVKVSDSWRKDLQRASILIGRSYNSSDIPTAFLFQMIALETLLTQRGDKYTEKLPSRIEAFLGWTGLWDTRNFPNRIERAYYLRCALVHAGELESIEIKDLFFIDDIVFNILNNLVNHYKIFASKRDIIEFAEKVTAERILGIKPSVRPQTIKFIERKYTAKDKEKI